MQTLVLQQSSSIKRHIGIQGNEIADRLTNTAINEIIMNNATGIMYRIMI